jgi:hypothetical protein
LVALPTKELGISGKEVVLLDPVHLRKLERCIPQRNEQWGYI